VDRWRCGGAAFERQSGGLPVGHLQAGRVGEGAEVGAKLARSPIDLLGDTQRAMSRENVELVREAFDAYNREGINGILRYLDPEVEWRNPADSPNAGVFVGHQGVLEWQRLADEAFDAMHFEPERIDELAEGRILTVSRFRFRARASDMDAEVAFAHLTTWRNGKATAVRMYSSEAAALNAVGLAE
jgi:ketosteroid isomerase-like protein